MNRSANLGLFCVLSMSVLPSSSSLIAVTHVYEVVEETFYANQTHANPYIDVDLWMPGNPW